MFMLQTRDVKAALITVEDLVIVDFVPLKGIESYSH